MSKKTVLFLYLFKIILIKKSTIIIITIKKKEGRTKNQVGERDKNGDKKWNFSKNQDPAPYLGPILTEVCCIVVRS